LSCSNTQAISIQYLGKSYGLYNSSINKLHIDNDGILWVATEEEVYWYLGDKLLPVKTHSRVFEDRVNNVSSIYSDEDDGIWFYNNIGGIYRFDKLSWSAQEFRIKERKYDSSALTGTAFLQADSGKIWVGTNQGIFSASLKDRELIEHKIEGVNSSNRVSIYTIMQLSTGRILLGTSAGLFGLDESDDRFVPLLKNSFSKHTIFLMRENEYLWVLTKETLFRVNKDTWEVFSQITIKDGIFNDFHLEENGNVWTSNLRGIQCTDSDGNVIKEFKHRRSGTGSISNLTSQIRKIGSDLWFVLRGSIAKYNYQKQDLEFIDFAPSMRTGSIGHSDAQNELVIDFSGNAWIASTDSLVKISNHPPKFKPISYDATTIGGLSSSFTRALLKDNENKLWIGSQDKGISMYDKISGKWKYYQHNIGDTNSLSHNHVRAMVKDKKGTLYIGTEGGGLNLFNTITNSWKEFKRDPLSDQIFSLYLQNEDTLWVGHGGGLSRFNILTQEFDLNENFDAIQGAPIVRAIVGDEHGNLWVGTHPAQHAPSLANSSSGGLFKFNVNDRDWQRFAHDLNDPNSLANNYVFSIAIDNAKDIWVGTWGGGLNLLKSGTNEFVRYTKSSGLLNNTVFAIAVDKKESLWISSTLGFTRFQPCHRKEFIENFDCSPLVKTYELSKEQFNIEFDSESFFSSEDGILYFGGKGGLVSFRPDTIEIGNPHKPENTFIVQLNIAGEQIYPHSEGILSRWIKASEVLTLSHYQRPIMLAIANNELTDPTRNRFKYRINKEPWIFLPLEQRTINFETMRLGTSTIEVQSSNSSGLWSRKSAKLDIEVLAPWYLTFWFKLTTIIALILILAAFILVYKRRKDLNEQRLNSLVELKTAELKESHDELSNALESKQYFFEAISHEIKTPVTLILNTLEILDNSSSKSIDKRHLELLKTNANNLHSQFSQLLALSAKTKLKSTSSLISLRDFVKELVNEFQSLAIRYKTEINVISGTEVMLIMDLHMLRVILSNLLSNAIKYSHPNTDVVISWQLKGFKLDFSISNTTDPLEPSSIRSMFHKFKRLPQHYTIPGSGIGLHVVQQYLNSIDASIKAYQDNEQILWFTICLPEELIFNRLNQKHPLTKLARNNAKNAKQNFRPKLLIVEDNEDMGAFLFALLEEDFDITIKANGTEALECLEVYTPDIIISDILMPKLNGFELCEKIRGLKPPTNSIPIIMLTGKSDLDSHKEGFIAGANDYIVKPFSGSILKAKVKSFLKIIPSLPKEVSEYALKHELKIIDHSKDERFANRFKEILKNNLEDSTLNVKKLANLLSMDERTLRRKTSLVFGEQPKILIRNYRLTCAYQMLAGPKPISTIAMECGFKTTNHFSKSFKARYGTSAKNVRAEKVL
jgi:ligand-binding sensor domain-containing protein/DNA-binding response OmpR family regulator